MTRILFLVLTLAAATGSIAACDSLRNPLSPGGDDARPSFADLLPNQTWTVGVAVNLALPAATGGDPPLTYTLTPALPAGLTFDAGARTVTGTPTAVRSPTVYVYTATDRDNDSTSIQFQVGVIAAP